MSSCCLAGQKLKHSFVGKKMFVENYFIVLGLTMPIGFSYILLGCREKVMVFFSFLSD